MATHTACRGCLDGCTIDEPKHCATCVNQSWPCDAHIRGRFLMSAASEMHFWRKHPPYGSSFLDCDHTICQEHRAALDLPLHGRPVASSTAAEGAP